MTDTTPKERYDTRRALRRAAADEPDWKTDEKLAQDYVFSLADRFVSAVEKFANAVDQKGAPNVE